MFIKVHSEITKAVVYRTGAFVTRTSTLHLLQGNNTLCFEKISGSMVGETVQISIPAGLHCNQVRYDANYSFKQQEDIEKETEELKALRERKLELEDTISTVQFLHKTISSEQMLEKQESFSVNELKSYMDYIYQKQNELLEEKRKLSKELENIRCEIEECVKNDKLRQEERSILSGVVLLEVEVMQEGDYTIEIMAYDRKVSWEPVYDICVDNLMLPMSVILKGKVYQQTGENWKNVKLIVSTGNLRQSNNQPELKEWKLEFQQLHSYSGIPVPPPAPMYAVPSETSVLGETTILETAELLNEDVKWRRNLNNVLENQTSIEYNIAGTYTLQDTAQGNMIEIIRSSIDAEYCYYVTPKAECSAYLMAIVKNWRSMEWLECDANIFLENRYVGATHINPARMDDLFKISLGKDRHITVSRHCIKRNTSQHLIGNMQSKEFEDLLEIRNEKNQQINIMVIDQIPVSDNEKIVVENVKISGAELDSKTGKVTWNRVVGIREKLELTIGFRVRWPKGMRINV